MAIRMMSNENAKQQQLRNYTFGTQLRILASPFPFFFSLLTAIYDPPSMLSNFLLIYRCACIDIFRGGIYDAKHISSSRLPLFWLGHNFRVVR